MRNTACLSKVCAVGLALSLALSPSITHAADPDPASARRKISPARSPSVSPATIAPSSANELTSPNRQWQVSQTSDAEQALQFTSADGQTHWAVAHPAQQNIGRTGLHLLQWSPDSQHVYVAERLLENTCAPFPMDINLYVVEVGTRQISTVLAGVGTSLTLSPDSKRLLYVAFNGRGMIIRNLEDGNEAPINAPYEGPRLKPLGNVVWSPDGQEAVFAAANNPCTPDMTFEIVWLNVRNLRRRTLLVGDTYQMRPSVWQTNNRVALRDKDGRTWLMNPRTGQLVESR
ncbi:MAG: hypothetical protein KIH69_001835 [Anaerolineae bacterium]|nr:hypothetical protein [Anaerolineae bacterium]